MAIYAHMLLYMAIYGHICLAVDGPPPPPPPNGHGPPPPPLDWYGVEVDKIKRLSTTHMKSEDVQLSFPRAPLWKVSCCKMNDFNEIANKNLLICQANSIISDALSHAALLMKA